MEPTLTPDPATVVVAYGDPQLLEGCLMALATPAPLVVVDNGGPGSSAERVAGLTSAHGGSVVVPGGNVGFARAVNAGLRHPAVEGRDVLLLNPDARIGWDGVLAVRAALRSGHFAAASPVLRYPDGSPQEVEWPLPSVRGEWLAIVGLLDRYRPAGSFLTGTVLMLRAEALAEIGGLDERFFLYGEEADWQRRARDRGWDTVLVPGIVATHQSAGTSTDEAERRRHFDRAAHTYIAKWYGDRGLASYRFAERLVTLRRRLLTKSPSGDASSDYRPVSDAP